MIGGGSIWLAEQMRKATAGRLELTRSGLREQSGLEVVHLDNIKAVERGMFAFKPSNGFLIRTHKPVGGRAWRPGLWWRMGRRIGVGGITSAGQAKFMADMMAVMYDGKIVEFGPSEAIYADPHQEYQRFWDEPLCCLDTDMGAKVLSCGERTCVHWQLGWAVLLVTRSWWWAQWWGCVGRSAVGGQW